MCEPISMGIMAAASLVTGGYSMYQQKRASDQAADASAQARKDTEEAAKTKGPTQQTIDDTDIGNKRVKALQAGLLGNMTAGTQGDLSKPAVMNYGLYTSTKNKMGA